MAKDPKNLFDFTDVSDLPEDLQKKLTPAANNMQVVQAWADILVQAKAAGLSEMTRSQMVAVAIRMGMDVPSDQTLLGYLNKGVDAGLIHKPSRQMYSAGKAKIAKEAVDTSEDAVITAEVPEIAQGEEDPLAGII